MNTSKNMVDAKIAEKRVMVFSKSYCPFCEEAKKIFSSYVRSSKLDPRDYEVMEIEDHPNCQNIQDYLRSITGARSVPRVFVNGKCIGGCDETAALHRSARLEAMLCSLYSDS